MGVKVYNKLVRDRIPEIIEADRNTCTTEILSDRRETQAACLHITFLM